MIGAGGELSGHVGLDRPGIGVAPNGAGAGHEVGAEGDFGELGVRKSRAKGSLRIDDQLLKVAIKLIAETALKVDPMVIVEYKTYVFCHVPRGGDFTGKQAILQSEKGVRKPVQRDRALAEVGETGGRGQFATFERDATCELAGVAVVRLLGAKFDGSMASGGRPETGF